MEKSLGLLAWHFGVAIAALVYEMIFVGQKTDHDEQLPIITQVCVSEVN